MSAENNVSVPQYATKSVENENTCVDKTFKRDDRMTPKTVLVGEMYNIGEMYNEEDNNGG